MADDDGVVSWLLEGDPAIRWQVQRDLLDARRERWEAERRRVVETGWVAEMLAREDGDGNWPKGRWTDDVWALLLLNACGLPEGNQAAARTVERMIRRLMPPGESVTDAHLLKRMDLCHLGFWTGLVATFLPGDVRSEQLARTVIGAQMEDGGWNCRIRVRPTRHGSFHTTFNVLEGLRAALDHGVGDEDAFRTAEEKAMEFMLLHRLFRSHTTGAIVDGRFTTLTYPWHWHYTALRGLDYMRRTPAIHDERAGEAIAWLIGERMPNGRWPLQSRIPGALLVEMEKPGHESRWNTLRALRVLKAMASA